VPDRPSEPKEKLAFWIHQGVEYLVGFLVISQALQASEPVVPIVAGAAVLLLALTADGPLAAFKAVPRRAHRVLDVVVAVGLVVLAVVARDSLGDLGLVVVVAVAASLGVLVYRTDYREPRRRGQRATAPARPAPVASAPAAEAPRRAPSINSEDVGRVAGRAVAKGIKAYRRRTAR